MQKLCFFFCIMILIGIAGNVYAQHPDPSLMNKNEHARYCIENLKDGALIVRLNFKRKAINALEQSGNMAGAERIRLEQEQENLEIMAAFKSYYKFSPVYFISYDSTRAALNGKRSGYFLNEQLQVDPSISMNKDFFLFAEHGMLETSLPSDKTNSKQEKLRRGTIEEALVVRDQKMNLLRRPFPYFVRFGDWDERVIKLERRIRKFYQQIQ